VSIACSARERGNWNQPIKPKMKRRWKRMTKKLTKTKEELSVARESSRTTAKKTKGKKMQTVTLKAIVLDLAPDPSPNLPDRPAAEVPAVAHGHLVQPPLTDLPHLYQLRLRTSRATKSIFKILPVSSSHVVM
jgi:hypothetical protein